MGMYDSGLDDRGSEDDNGTIRRKRSDTLIGTLREEYGEDFRLASVVTPRWAPSSKKIRSGISQRLLRRNRK